MPVTLKVLMSGLPFSSISTSMFTSNAVRAAIADVGIRKFGLAPRETISGGSSRGGRGAALAQAAANAQAAGSREAGQVDSWDSSSTRVRQLNVYNLRMSS